MYLLPQEGAILGVTKTFVAGYPRMLAAGINLFSYYFLSLKKLHTTRHMRSYDLYCYVYGLELASVINNMWVCSLVLVSKPKTNLELNQCCKMEKKENIHLSTAQTA